MSTTNIKRLIATAAALLLTAAAPSVALADIHIVKYVDKSSPVIYEGPTQAPTPPSK